MNPVVPISAGVELATGQRMSREEFLWRWEQLPELKFAELVEGVVYVGSPLSAGHGTKDHLGGGWLAYYRMNTPGVIGSTNATWFMLESVPQPDQILAIEPGRGGQSRIEGLYHAGAPELVLETCWTSPRRDKGPKLALYQRAGVREYIMLEVKMERVQWRCLVDGSYEMLEPGADGVYRSREFPGLWLNAAAFWAGDGKALLATLNDGLASPEYAAFAQGLGAR